MSVTSCRWVALLLAGFLAACGGGGGGDAPSAPTPSAPTPPTLPAPTYTVTATVSGLTGTGLTLANNSGSPIAVTANGPVTIASDVASGTSYSVSIQSQPTASPREACRIVAGTGTISTSNVTNIAVECRPLIGKFVYAASRGSLLDIGPLQITGYRIDAATGRLASLPNFPVTPPSLQVVGSPTAKLQLLFIMQSPDDRYLIASRLTMAINLGGGGFATDTGGILTSYRIDADTGGLTEVSSLGLAPGVWFLPSMAMHPNGRYIALLSAPVNAFGGYTAAPALTVMDLNPATGALSLVPGGSAIALPSYSPGQFGPSSPPQIGGAPVFNSSGTAVYALVNFGRRSVAMATFSPGGAGSAPYIADGWQALLGPEPGNASSTQTSTSTGLAVSPDGRRVAATAGYFNTDANGVFGNITTSTATVAVMNVDPVTGVVTSRTAPDLVCSDCWLSGTTFSADGQSLISSNPGYYPGKTRDQENPGAPFAGPTSLYSFGLNSSGVPSMINGAPFALGQNGVQYFRLHPFARNAYFGVTSTGASGGVAAMHQASDGTWSSLGTLVAPGASTSVYGIDIDDSGRYLYAADLGQDQVHAFSIDQVSGQITLLNSVPAQVDPGTLISVGTQMMP